MYPNICVIHIYWGPLPDWLPFFITSCRFNAAISFIIFTDSFALPQTSENIKCIYFTLKDFNILATKKLELPIQIEKPYKVCDFKPAFGKIFEDYLKHYEFWGYCDNDLIFGNIQKFITQKILINNDIISTYKGFLSGPFCLFRNHSRINNLFTKSPCYQKIYCTSKECMGYDEHIPRSIHKGCFLLKLYYFIIFFLSRINFKFKFKHINEIKYQFQWFYKKERLGIQVPLDMSEIVWQVQKQNEVNCHFQELLISDAHYNRIKKTKWVISWHEGNLKEVTENQEMLGFHFINSKKNASFYSGNLTKETDLFMITGDFIK
jgi:hypothetical protein